MIGDPLHAVQESVLGGLMLAAQAGDKATLATVLETLPAEAFLEPRLKTIYRAVFSVYSDHRLPDFVTVAAELDGELQHVGGVSYVASLPNCIATHLLLSQYVDQLKDRLARRTIKARAKRLQYDSDYEDDLAALVTSAVEDFRSSVPTTGGSVGTELLEVTGAELADAGASGPRDLPSLPLLGQPGYLVPGWSHLLAGYPRSGKTELLTRCAQEWTGLGYSILYMTEEPKSIWEHRLSRLQADWGLLCVAFGLGADPEMLFKRAFGGSEQIVVLDTLRNLLGLEDETDNSEVARVLNPWVAEARRCAKTLIMDHHMRKGAGSYGEGIAGGHALLGVFDVALELLRDENHPHRRQIRAYARLISPADLAYELGEDDQYRALGDPDALRLAEVQERVLGCLDLDWRPTKNVRDSLGNPQPSEEQVRQALVALAHAGKIERDPPIDQGAVRGKPHRWRLPSSVPTESPIVGTQLAPLGGANKCK